MKAFSMAFLAVALCAMTLVGCDNDKDRTNMVYVDVPDPVVTNTNVTTPGGLTIVEVVDPNGKLQDPNSGITQDLLNKDLDYQTLYVWYQREHLEAVDFNTWLKSARFHLILDTKFRVNRDRDAHYAVLPVGFDVYLAVLRQSSDGHYCADGDKAMDLLSGDVHDGHDSPVTLVAAPNYPTSGYFVVH